VTAVTTPADMPFGAEVARYLADCADWAHVLRAADHPTAESAVKVIWHAGKDQADQIRAAFRAATVSGTSPVTRPATRDSETGR
jgi:hypothetical protein